MKNLSNFLFSLLLLGLLGVVAASVIVNKATTTDTATEDISNTISTSNIFTSEEIVEYMAKEVLLGNLKSFKLEPFDSLHPASPELIDTLSKTSDLAFSDSARVSPIIRHERPGLALFGYNLYGICAKFRASKCSISPEAFSAEEKREFVETISKLGVFVEVAEGATELDQNSFGAVLSSSLVTNHFCRDSLRIVASVLDANQISWLLNHSPSVILLSPEFLDQLQDFSMFEGSHVCDALISGNYDWFKNERALRTLSASALLQLFTVLRYDLSFKQLEALNSVRSIEELYNEPEFVENPLVWQITAGTPHFKDEHINIDAFVEEIKESSNRTCLKDLKQAIFGLYVHSEHAITIHLNALISGSIAVQEGAQIDLTVHINALENLFHHRQKVLKALLCNVNNGNIVIPLPLKRLVGFFVTPSTLILRKAMEIKEKVNKEYFDNDNEIGSKVANFEDLIKELKSVDSSYLYQEKIALIFAYIEIITNDSLKVPYRVPPTNYVATSTLGIIQRFDSLRESEIMMVSKWPRIFLLQQACDFVVSRHLQDNDNSTLKVIFDTLLTNCDLKGFDEFTLELLKAAYPDDSLNLIAAIKESASIASNFNDFRDDFMQILERHQKISLTTPLNTIDIFNLTLPLSVLESELMSLIQNKFKVDFVSLLGNDSELLAAFCEFGFLLKRSQVQDLLKDENGRKLLSENRELLYNLPTYEDFKVLDLKAFKFKAQYATMIRTVPLIPLLISFKTDSYTFNDPLGVAWRLFGAENDYLMQNPDLLMNLWRIAPFQFFAEAWHPKNLSVNKQELYIRSSQITPFLMKNREIEGKLFESLRSILHWIILQELKFLEAFTLINSCEAKEKRVDAMNALLYLNKAEIFERRELSVYWKYATSKNSKLRSNLPFSFMDDFQDVLNSPMSSVRAAALLVKQGVMDANIRFNGFNKLYEGFDDWINTIKMRSNAQDIKSESESTNIPRFRELIENDIKDRHFLMRRMLNDLDVAMKLAVNDSIWKNRLRLLGMVSGDGFTLSPSFQTTTTIPLNLLPIHETVLHHKLSEMTGLIGGHLIPDELKPDKLAVKVWKRAGEAKVDDDVDNNKEVGKCSKGSKNKKNKSKKKK